ncbi:MAG: diaminopimelate decarboxylase [Synergistaceae bacterium]|jgi:diaminopimelate decarboxylase|nr:diaminopimelate decarboxylase [Synergistaceae bacterium]
MSNFKFHGVDVTGLAHEYGTPLYVVSEDEIVRRIRAIKGCFDERNERCSTFFASKSFLTKDMLRILMREGLGLDVVSGGELFLAQEMRFPPEKIAFHGNSKTEREIAAGLDCGVGKFVCDSMDEIELIDRMAGERGANARVLIRVTPGVEAHTHKYMSTGETGSKFGLPPEMIKEVVSSRGTSAYLSNISLMGFHFHVGSQLMDNSTNLEALGVILGLIKELRDDYGFETRILDMGGGFGVRYTKKDNPQNIADFIGGMVDKVESFCRSYGLSCPSLVIEPGRWIVSDAGITLYSVGSVKRLPGGAVYVGVDGGYPDNPRPALYGAEYEAVLVNKVDLPPSETVSIAGKCCESGDILIRDIELPEAQRGDLIAVLGTGAYNHSMANNYNKNPIPAVVMVKDGTPRLSVRRQTYEEMFSGNI